MLLTHLPLPNFHFLPVISLKPVLEAVILLKNSFWLLADRVLRSLLPSGSNSLDCAITCKLYYLFKIRCTFGNWCFHFDAIYIISHENVVRGVTTCLSLQLSPQPSGYWIQFGAYRWFNKEYVKHYHSMSSYGWNFLSQYLQISIRGREVTFSFFSFFFWFQIPTYMEGKPRRLARTNASYAISNNA